jgi:hypothetical protein
MSITSIEGRLLVRVGTRGVSLRSTRSPLASKLFSGRGPREVLSLLPRVYAVCGRAQLVAAATAMDAVRGRTASAGTTRARGMIVDAESLREHLLRVLLGWGGVLGHEVHPVILSAVMALPEQLSDAFGAKDPVFYDAESGSQRFRGIADLFTHVDVLLRNQILGLPADEWLKLRTPEEALAVPEALALGPRFLRWLLEQEHAEAGSAVLPVLPDFDAAWLEEKLGSEQAEGFTARPDWRGAACETGVYARQRHHPLVEAFSARWGHGLISRSAARLVEIALLAGRLGGEGAGAIVGLRCVDAGPPSGYGIVETARGRLVHRVVLEGETVSDFRMLAPTEWNFHPDGIAAACLERVGFDERMCERAGLLIEAIDPCIGYRIEVENGA